MSKLIAIMIDKMNQHAVGKGNTKIFSSAKTIKHVWILALRMFCYGTKPNKPEELNWNHSLLLFPLMKCTSKYPTRKPPSFGLSEEQAKRYVCKQKIIYE